MARAKRKHLTPEPGTIFKAVAEKTEVIVIGAPYFNAPVWRVSFVTEKNETLSSDFSIDRSFIKKHTGRLAQDVQHEPGCPFGIGQTYRLITNKSYGRISHDLLHGPENKDGTFNIPPTSPAP